MYNFHFLKYGHYLNEIFFLNWELFMICAQYV